MRVLSKSKLMAYRQCRKRLWLEVYRQDLRDDSAAVQTGFSIGDKVGEIARRLYDTEGNGVLIDAQKEGFDSAFARSADLLGSAQPIFEAGFSAGGALAFADVLLPLKKQGKRVWRMVEVKSSTRVKDYHLDDTAIQAYIAKTAGVNLDSIALAHIDSRWVYPGEQDYSGLLKETDLSEQAFGRSEEVKRWIVEAQTVITQQIEPSVDIGKHCGQPFACGFSSYCQSQQPSAQYPVQWLPRLQSRVVENLGFAADMRDLANDMLNAKQRLVKQHTLAESVYFDRAGANASLAKHTLPAYFLDFETIQFAVPIWPGTRPYQQITFQFSVHHMAAGGELSHQGFLDLSGDDPSVAFAQSLIDACGENGPVFVYNAGFETARIRELAQRFPYLSAALLAINARVVDLLPVAREYYYHPSQQGSWSIKKVLPAIAPDLSYVNLDGVQDGGMAMNAFLEAIHLDTSAARKAQIAQQLTEYCKLDTYAMVRLWQFFAGQE